MSRDDDFNGDNAHLVSCIDALLDLDDAKALVPHGLGGRGSHVYRLLVAARCRLAHQPAEPPRGDDITPRIDTANAKIIASSPRARLPR